MTTEKNREQRMICTKCHKNKATWDFKDEHYCQMCFEEWCNDEFWNAVDEGNIFQGVENEN